MTSPAPKNLCPLCDTPIRKNAKLCAYHAAQRDLESKDKAIAVASHWYPYLAGRRSAQRQTEVTNARKRHKLEKLKAPKALSRYA